MSSSPFSFSSTLSIGSSLLRLASLILFFFDHFQIPVFFFVSVCFILLLSLYLPTLSLYFFFFLSAFAVFSTLLRIFVFYYVFLFDPASAVSVLYLSTFYFVSSFCLFTFVVAYLVLLHSFCIAFSSFLVLNSSFT